MAEAEKIPYSLLKRIIEDCPDKRTQALLAFQYAMGNRVGELACEYRHWKHRCKRITSKKVRPRVYDVTKGKEFKSEGIRRDHFFKTKYGLEWTSPNFKNRKEPTKKAWLLKDSEPWLYGILVGWLETNPDARFLFNIRERRIRQLVDEELKKYNKEYHSHCLRHSRASHIGDVTGDPFVVKEVLGHKELASSSRYVSIGLERLKAKMAGKRFEDVLGRRV